MSTQTIAVAPGDNAVLSAAGVTVTVTVPAPVIVPPPPPPPPPVPTVQFTGAGSSGSESVSAVSIPLSLSGPSVSQVTVSYAITAGSATAGVDFTVASGTIIFPAGVTSKTIPLTVLDDVAVEIAETVIITLSAPLNATLGTPSTHTYTIVSDDIAPPTPGVSTDVGINLEQLLDYARAWMLVNVFTGCRQLTGSTNTAGWPIGTAQFRILTGTDHHESGDPLLSKHGSHDSTITGAYLFSCDGNVIVTGSNCTISSLAYSSATGKTTCTITVASSDTNVDITLAPAGSTTVTTGIKINRPGYPIASAKTFTDEFLAFISHWRVLRCMDILITNTFSDTTELAARAAIVGSDGKLSWSERPSFTAPRWLSAFGVPVELLVQLANESGKDLWLNISNLANDDYVTGLAAYCKANLAPTCKLYIEYSNEVWNSIFKQSGDTVALVAPYIASGVAPTLDGQNVYYNARLLTIKRLIEISNIFRSQFGDAAMMTRIRPVFADQIASPAFATITLNWVLRKYPQPPSYYIYGLAGAPYYGPSNSDTRTAEEMITHATDGVVAKLNKRVLWSATDDGSLDNKQAQYYSIAQAYGLAFLCYEGGWDAGQGTTNLDARNAASYDARMEGITFAHVAQAYAHGCTLFCYFNASASFTQYGQWGVTDDVRAEYASLAGVLAKAKGLIAVANSDPRTLELAQIDLNAAYYGKTTGGTLGTGTGLTGRYYRGSAFAEPPDVTRVDRVLNFTWQNYGNGMPYGRKDITDNSTKGFSVRWRGYFTARFTGSHKFTLETQSDTITFTLGAQNMITGDTITLTAGVPVALAIDFTPSSAGFSTNGKVRLFIEVDGGRKKLVPQSYLTPV